MIMQSYDFYYMFQHYGCNMQFGGNDQWSNMLGGTELIRRKLGKDAHAMTITLLLNSEGKKMGKTAAGAVWLDPNKTSPYDFYQYWRNVDDADVLKCLRMLTFLPLEQINEMDSWEGSQLNKAKEILAFELTSLVHGEEEAKKAEASAKALFGCGASGEMPTTELSETDLADGAIDIMSALVLTGLCSSKSEARRNIQQGGISANDEKVSDIGRSFTTDELKAGVVLKRGKKKLQQNYSQVRWIGMSIEKGRAYFRQFGMEDRVREFDVSSATVELAALALGVEGARIAKTLSFKKDDSCILILAAGDARIDNHKFKEKFHMKAKMLAPEEVLSIVGHPVGGVCPFGINDGIDVYLDESLKRFETVFPAVGSANSAIELDLDELYKYSNAIEWIDVCKLPE